MDYEKKYKDALQAAKHALDCEKQGLITTDRVLIERMFPELKESEDEKMWKLIKKYAHCNISAMALNADNISRKELETWLEKQGEQKPIMNVPSREVILAIWDLGNEWKEFTSGDISTEYGTQLDYIQKHWHESEYYLREKQSEKKLTFNADDWYVSNVDGKIHNVNISSEKQREQKSKETIKSAQETIDDWHKRQGTSVKTTAYGTFGNNGAIEYVYILDYCSGRIIVAKHDMEESIETLFDKLGLKESQCQYMVSTDILSIEYINF